MFYTFYMPHTPQVNQPIDRVTPEDWMDVN